MKWKPLSDEAYSGQMVRVKTRGGRSLNASWGAGAYENENGSCGGWAAENEDEAPGCWTDGVCWAENDSGVPSDPPVAWAPIVRMTAPSHPAVEG